jgi:hypothetical protein
MKQENSVAKLGISVVYGGEDVNSKVEPEPEPRVALTARGMARLALINVRDTANPDINHEKARAFCMDLLQAAGFDLPDAESRLQQFLDGQLQEEDLLDQIDAGFERIKNQPEED